MEIRTDHLRLVLQSPAEVQAMLEGLSPEDRAEVSPAWVERVLAATEPDAWTHGFRLIHHECGRVVGHCAFKAPPDSEGAVEIAYGVEPAHQGQGFATEAAKALVRFAFGTGEVQSVRAHTRAEPNASTRVLSKCGFRCLGEVVDPEDGVVWRWEIDQQNAASTP